MKKQLIIIGAGGHGRVVADIARLRGYENVAFLDDQKVGNVNQIGSTNDFTKYIDCADFFVGIGNNNIRKELVQKLESHKVALVSLIHPNATVAEGVQIGKGVAVMAGAVINVGAVVKDGAIINTCASVDHDCMVGAFAHISVGSHLAGTVTVGDRTMIGAGAVVVNNCSICGDCMIGAGAIVVKDITVAGTYVGVPVEKIK